MNSIRHGHFAYNIVELMELKNQHTLSSTENFNVQFHPQRNYGLPVTKNLIEVE